jgi:hypothetical protein
MSDTNAGISQQGQTPRTDRWRLFLLVASSAHAVALFGCPSIAVPPRISHQLVKVGIGVAVCAVPFLSSLFLLFRYRTLSERVIAFGSLAVSLVWLALAYSFIGQALRGP